MTDVKRVSKARVARGLGVLVAVAGLSACDLVTHTPPPADFNFEANHPIVVDEETLSTSLDLMEQDGVFSSRDARKLQRYVDIYLSRGSGAMIVETSFDGMSEDGEERLAAVRALMLRQGIRDDEISLVPGSSPGGTANTVTLTFRAAKVVVPECGDWSGESSFRITNSPHSNFGCAFRRNVGLMVANPNDLVRARTMGDRDADRSVMAITKYRSGDTGEDVEANIDTNVMAGK